MYKVFIENTQLILIKPKDFIPTEGIIFFQPKINRVKDLLFNWISTLNKSTMVYIVHENPEKVLKKLFKNYDFVEAAGGIVKRKNSFLFIKRNGLWDIPKGKLDKNESPEKGAIREIEEECGISNPLIESFICSTYHTYEYKGVPTLKKTYWYTLNYSGKEKLKPQTEEGITDVKWFKANQLDTIKNNTFASINEVLEKVESR